MSRSHAILVATVSTFILGQSAFAADMPIKAPLPTAAPVWTWGGWYAGINLGYGIADASLTDRSSSPLAVPTLLSNTTHMAVSGVIGGGQIGYNWMIAPNWLAGLEADFQGSGQRKTDRFSNVLGASLVDSVRADVDWFGTARGRIGYITDSTLWYVTGGYAYGRTELSLTSSNSIFLANPAAGTFHKTAPGWTIGGGLESHLFGNWTGKIEYLYVDLGTITGTANSSLAPGLVATSITTSAHIRDDIIRAGLNYQFAGERASAATMPLRAPAAASAWNWAGWYVGVNLGYGVADASLMDRSTSPVAAFTVLSNTTHMAVSGVIGGGQIGYNWMIAPNWLAGLEADFQDSGQRKTDRFSSAAPPISTDSVGVDINWFGTMRGRLGYITDNSNLFYVTGGFAYAQTELKLASTNAIFVAFPAAAQLKQNDFGWTLGGGLESHLFGNWTGKIEYLYVDLGTITGTANGFGGPGIIDTSITTNVHIHDNIMRVGLNSKF